MFRPSGTEVTPPPAPPPATPAAGDWGNSQVDIVYAEPQDPQFRPIRDRLMRRQVLEQLRLFLSPLRLPRKLLVRIDQCNAERRPYQTGGPVTICYEYIAKVDQIAPRNQPAGGLPRETMIVGAFIQAVLHEVAVATFDILEIPVWGREADAADKLAGFIMVQFGKDVALKIMIGAAWFFDASDRHLERSRFRQRAFAGGAALLQLSLHRLRLRPGVVQVPDRPEPAAGPPRATLHRRVLRAAPCFRQGDPAARGPASCSSGCSRRPG